MKKAKFILPMTAFIFAVVAAFATNSFKSNAVDYFYKDSGGICVDCEVPDAKIEECSTDNLAVICECQDTGAQIGLSSDEVINCQPLTRENP